MPFSAPSDVRVLYDTGLSDGQLAALIEESDSLIGVLLGDPVENPLLRRLSVLLTARAAALRDPRRVSVGGYSEESDLEAWGAEIRGILRSLRAPRVKAQGYSVIDEEERYRDAETR